MSKKKGAAQVKLPGLEPVYRCDRCKTLVRREDGPPETSPYAGLCNRCASACKHG
jgi:hypothetical protein